MFVCRKAHQVRMRKRRKKQEEGQEKQIQVCRPEEGSEEEIIIQQLQGRRKEQEQNDAFEIGLHKVKTIKTCIFQLCAAAHAHMSRAST